MKQYGFQYFQINRLERGAFRLMLARNRVPFVETKGLFSSVFESKLHGGPHLPSQFRKEVWWRKPYFHVERGR